MNGEWSEMSRRVEELEKSNAGLVRQIDAFYENEHRHFSAMMQQGLLANPLLMQILAAKTKGGEDMERWYAQAAMMHASALQVMLEQVKDGAMTAGYYDIAKYLVETLPITIGTEHNHGSR